MADLNISSVSDGTKTWENVGQNLVYNGDFEIAPSFTAATTATSVWVDGTAAGSGTNDLYGWATINKGGTAAIQFDTSVFHGGANSLKISTQATTSRFDAGNIKNAATASNVLRYGIPILPSQAYAVTYYLKTNYTSGDSTNGIVLILAQYNSAGGSITSNTTNSVKTTIDWTQKTSSITSNALAAFLELRFSIPGNSGSTTNLILDAWIDDIVLSTPNSLHYIDAQLGALVTPGIQDVNGPKIWS